jgi:sugar transferase (PEP-CTERM/EpsH1 system associated)
MPRKKVLHILHAFSHGGLENGIVNIINGSPPDLEHELCLLTTGGEFLGRLHKPIRYYELHKKPGNSIDIILRIRRVIRESGANVVHTRNWASFDGVIAACLCRGVTVLHGEHGRDITDPNGLIFRRNLLRRLFGPRISKFTTVSEDLERWLSQKIKIPKSKIVLIRNGVDSNRFRPHRNPQLRKELGIADNEFVIGTIGRLDPVKNHAGLIRAFAALAKRTGNLRLVIVGDGPERDNLNVLIGSLGINPLAILTGYRGDTERFYGLFDIFVLNSFAEGMSNTILEAMSSGLPVICTEVGANNEIVQDDIAGTLIPANEEKSLIEALETYKNSEDLRIQTGLNAKERILKSFSLSRMVEQYNDLYLHL